MSAYIARRLMSAFLVLMAVITLVFILMTQIGDPAAATLGNRANEDTVREFNARYGLDRPLGAQFLGYLGVIACQRPSSPVYDDDPATNGYCGLLQGDFGESFLHNAPVADVILRRLPRTLLLGALALLFELAIGLGFGVFAALRRNRWQDTSIMSTAYLGQSLPSYVTGPIFLSYAAFLFGLFPVGGYGSTPLEHLQHAVLPAFTLAILGASTYARVTRSEMLDALQSDYVRTAKAKGLGRSRVLSHALRNALLPVVTLAGLSLRLLVGGAIITEQIYGWPGMGKLAVESIVNVDAPTVMGVVFFVALAVQLGNLLADLAVAALDPRVRLAG